MYISSVLLNQAKRMMIMNIDKLVETISEKVQMPKTSVKAVLEALGETGQEVLLEKDEFTIPNLAKMKVTTAKARKGRNPKTGEDIHIEAKMKVSATPVKAIKDKVALLPVE
ncbi:HU family DNA-binding protein [Vibrio cholerae]|uniref:Viral histone-like protein n=1 Tax=Vibrio cholerae TaxID=666 RepID=A0A5Q6PCX8_VIBCL|nr:HU family DNA-binding protein [Vibrio cholerae]